MRKVLILVLGLSLTAASCNLFGGGSGTRGVLRSEDGAETFAQANTLEPKGNISGINVNSFVFDPSDPSKMYIGSSSGMHKTENGGDTWKHTLANMRVGDIAIDPAQTDVIYAAGITGENGRVLKSVDHGATWVDIYTEATKNNPALAVAVAYIDSDIILVGLNGGEMLKSTDGGSTWQVVQDFANPIIEIEYADINTVYALTQGSGLYVSTTQGSIWEPVAIAVDANQPRYSTTKTYYDVSIDPSDPSRMFVSSQQGLLRTIDAGATWVLVSIPVTNETLSVTATGINPTNSSNLYIGVGSTLFETQNGGRTWETKKLPTQQKVRHILINPDEPNNIYLGLTSQ